MVLTNASTFHPACVLSELGDGKGMWLALADVTRLLQTPILSILLATASFMASYNGVLPLNNVMADTFDKVRPSEPGGFKHQLVVRGNDGINQHVMGREIAVAPDIDFGLSVSHLIRC